MNYEERRRYRRYRAYEEARKNSSNNSEGGCISFIVTFVILLVLVKSAKYLLTLGIIAIVIMILVAIYIVCSKHNKCKMLRVIDNNYKYIDSCANNDAEYIEDNMLQDYNIDKRIDSFECICKHIKEESWRSEK